MTLKHLSFIILLLSCTVVFAQHRKKKDLLPEFTPREVLLDEIAEECFFSNKYNIAERNKFYPFNKAAHIVLISFKEGQNIPVNHKVLDTQKVLEQVILNRQQTDSLTSLFYNIGHTPVQGAHFVVDHAGSCYEPRNGILFINSVGKILAYLEICFMCRRTEPSSDKVNDARPCLTKYDLLRNFFRSAGIKYGTNEQNEVLSYHEIFKLDSGLVVYAIKNKLSRKTHNGTYIDSLNDVERTLFFATNALQVYDYEPSLSGIARFYLYNSGNYYDQTLISLKRIGSILTRKTLELSKLQWPNEIVPRRILDRRPILANIINQADPQWQKLSYQLFDHQENAGADVMTSKENLGELIFNFARSNQEQLHD